MGGRQYRLLGATLACALAIALLLAPAGYAAGSVATTDAATNITGTSATLNGTVNTISSNSTWFFQYGTSTSYGHQTTPQPIGAVSNLHVSASVTGLTRGVTYHFRLVVQQNVGYNPTTSDGQDLTFTTPSSSGATATTGDATSITSTSAILNGVADTTDPVADWFFQYGNTTAYGHVAKGSTLHQGVTAVSVRVTGLSPNTTYHFRLVVAQGSYPTTYSAGQDATFTTKPAASSSAKLTLVSRRLIVRKHRVAIRLKCAGPSGSRCKGKLAVTATRKVGKRLRKVKCAAVKFTLAAGKKRTFKAKVSRGCLALLRHSKRGRHKATFKATFPAPQKPLKRRVTLIFKH